MPTIPQYNQQVRERGKLDARVDPGAASQVAGAIQGAGRALFGVGTDIQEMNERKDRSDLQAEIARARQEATVSLQEDIQTGAINSDDYLTEYNNRINQKLDGLGAVTRTRAGREIAGAQKAVLSSEFATHAATAKITADGQQMALNFDRALNDSGNTLLLDPTQYQAVREQWLLSLDDPSGPYGRMSAEQKQKAKLSVDKNLAKWYIQGATEKLGPEYAMTELNSGKYDSVFDADTKQLLLKAAEVEKRSRTEDIQRERTVRLQLEADEDKKTRTSILQRMERPDVGGLTFKEIVNSFNDPVQAEHMRDVLRQRLANPDQPSNPWVFLDIQRKIYLPAGHPDKISDPFVVTQQFAVNKQISRSDMITLLQDMEVAKSQDTLGPDLQSVSNQVYSTFSRSPLGQVAGADLLPMADGAMYRWRQDVNRLIAEKREKGEDPRELLNPRSKDYVAAPERLSTYLTTSQAAVATSAAGIREPQVGQVVDFNGLKFKFLGGDKRDPKSWEEVRSVDPSDAPIPKVPGT